MLNREMYEGRVCGYRKPQQSGWQAAIRSLFVPVPVDCTAIMHFYKEVSYGPNHRFDYGLHRIVWRCGAGHWTIEAEPIYYV